MEFIRTCLAVMVAATGVLFFLAFMFPFLLFLYLIAQAL